MTPDLKLVPKNGYAYERERREREATLTAVLHDAIERQHSEGVTITSAEQRATIDIILGLPPEPPTAA